MSGSNYMQLIYDICQTDGRFCPEAYINLSELLEYTSEKIHKNRTDKATRHVTGQDIVREFRPFMLEKYGPMAKTLVREWGLTRCRDLGTMVYILIEKEIFTKRESDSIEDFEELYTFDDAFGNYFDSEN